MPISSKNIVVFYIGGYLHGQFQLPINTCPQVMQTTESLV